MPMELRFQDLNHVANRPQEISTLQEILQTAQENAEGAFAEEAFQENVERFWFATHGGEMFAYQWDLRSDVIILRSRLNGGVTCTTGQAVLAKVQPNDREQILATVATLRAENPVYCAVFRVSHPDGRVVWLEATGRASFDAHGALLRVIGIAVDTTERERKGEER